MNESLPKGGWKIGRDSFSKMICWFKDGNQRLMYSIDWSHRFSKRRDRQQGLSRFKRKIAGYGVKARTVEIYDTITGKLIEKYKEGEPVAVTGSKACRRPKNDTTHKTTTPCKQ